MEPHLNFLWPIQQHQAAATADVERTAAVLHRRQRLREGFRFARRACGLVALVVAGSLLRDIRPDLALTADLLWYKTFYGF